LFSDIENKDTQLPDFSTPQPYNQKNLGQFYRIEPVMDSNSLTIVWNLPYLEHAHDTKPLTYHSHILGHEGKGSLLSNLMKDGLATSTSTYVDHVLGSYTNFYLDVQLTDKGIANYGEVLQRVWAQIKHVKDQGPQKYIYEDYQKQNSLSWKFLEKSSYSYYTTWLSSRMQLFNEDNIDNVLSSAHLINEFDPKHVDELSNQLHDHSNCNIYLTSKTNEGKTDQKEKWYGTNFAKEPLSESILSNIYSGAVYDDLSLPIMNKYIPDNLDLLPPNEKWSTEPTKIKDDAESVIWYKKDDKFGQPKCMAHLRIYKKKNQLLDDTHPMKQAYNDIWTDVYDEVLR
jgi:insulysin